MIRLTGAGGRRRCCAGRAWASRLQVDQRHLEHALRRHPEVGLVAVKMKGLDRARVGERARTPASPVGSAPPARCQGVRFRESSRGHPGGWPAAPPARRESGPPKAGRPDDRTEALLIGRRLDGRQSGGDLRFAHQCESAVTGAAAGFCESATRFAARRSDSNVPASVHQPSR